MNLRLRHIAPLCLLLLTACTEPPPISLTSEERAQIDTLYGQRVQVLRPQLDSLCDARFRNDLKRVTDSLVQARRVEEARLRERILRERLREEIQ